MAPWICNPLLLDEHFIIALWMDEKRASQFLQRDDYASNHRHRERERERERGHWHLHYPWYPTHSLPSFLIHNGLNGCSRALYSKHCKWLWDPNILLLFLLVIVRTRPACTWQFGGAQKVLPKILSGRLWKSMYIQLGKCVISQRLSRIRDFVCITIVFPIRGCRPSTNR